MTSPNFVLLKTSEKNRGGILSDLECLTNKNNPNFVNTFSQNNQLILHLTRRIKATVDKRIILYTLLYAENRKQFSLQIGGALKQDRSGSAGDNKTKGYCNGFQAGHIAIGTYSINGQVISHQGLQFLKSLPNYSSERDNYKYFSSLLAYALALDGMTEFVPAYINQSMGKIETTCIHYMKGLIPVYIPNTQLELEKQLKVESERVVNFFLNIKPAFLNPIKERLFAIKHGRAKEYLQNPSEKCLLFNGKETEFLEAIIAVFETNTSQFSAEIERNILNNSLINAKDFSEKAELAKQEIQAFLK